MTQKFYFRASLLTLFCFVGGILVTFAAEEESTDTSVPTDYLCTQVMMDEGAAAVATYEVFLDEYFKVDAPSSEQFENALDQYRFTELAINAIYEANLNLEDPDAPKTQAKAADEVADCDYVRDAYLNYSKTLFQKQFTGSTVSKVTFKVVDGLKAMNKDLDDMSTLFGQTFPGMFNQLNNNLPCYAKSCVTQ